MSTEIKTNKISYMLNYAEYDNRYDLFCIETSEKYIKRGAYILDAAVLCDGIKAIKFESGRKVTVLMSKNQDNSAKLKDLIKCVDDGDKLIFSKLEIKEVEDYILIQLLLNSLGSYDSDYLRFNNLTGHLYCFHPSWIRHGKDRGTDVIWGLQSLEIAVTPALSLTLSVRSFSSELLKNKITFKNKKFEDYPKYVFTANQTLSRKLSDNSEIGFIMRQIDGEKKEITFLNLQSLEKFEQTKMGVLSRIIDLFNDKYSEVCQLDFEKQEILERIDYTRAVQRENINRISAVLADCGINIVDQICDDYSEMFCDNMRELFESKYSINARIGKRVKKDKLNIVLIHNAEYYNGTNDPHDREYKDVAIQYVTLEDFADSSEFAIATVAHEVIIKRDIVDNKISLFSWDMLGFSEDVSFGMEFEIKDDKRYFFMIVHPDGSFDFKEQEFTLFEMNEYTELVDVFEQAKTASETVKGVVRYEDGAVNVIKDTNLFTVPEIGQIKDLLYHSDNKLRGKERREELLSSSLDIKMFGEGEEKYYFVGTIGEGMKPSIQRSAVIRKVQGVNGAQIKLEKLLPLMNVSFVHNGQLTVIPFPFKYLREYVKMIS